MKKRFVEDAEPYRLYHISDTYVGDSLPDVPQIILLKPVFLSYHISEIAVVYYD